MKQDKSPFQVIYEDDKIIVVYKKRDVFTVATKDKKTLHHNLFYYLSCYLGKKGEKAYIVHRLDYETSGLLIFAKNHELQIQLRSLFEKRAVVREYEAVIQERIPLDYQQIVKMYLTSGENGTRVKQCDSQEGREAITEINASNYIQIGTALKIRIHTGRRNQIRLALHSLGFTLLGDKRYSNHHDKRMYLNCYHLSFPPDFSNETRDFYIQPLWLIENEL